MFLIRSAARDIYLHGATLWLAAPDQKRAERNRTGERAEQDSGDYEKKWAGKGKIRQDREEKGESQDRRSDERHVLF